MGKTLTIAGVRSDVEKKGWSYVPFTTVEYLLGLEHTDDDTFLAAIDSLVETTAWVDTAIVLWVDRYVLFRGPKT